MADKTNIDSFTQTFKNREVIESTVNIASSFLDDGASGVGVVSSAVESLPLLGPAWTITSSVSDVLLHRKIFKFFKECGDVALIERSKEAKKVSTKDTYRSDVGEALLNYINRINSQFQINLIATLYTSLVLNEISVEDFHQLASATDKLTSGHLEIIREIDSHFGPLLITDKRAPLLALNELIATDLTPHDDGYGFRYVTTDLGKKLVDITTNLSSPAKIV